MNHSITSVSQLYGDTKYLHDNVVEKYATDVLSFIESAINNLKENWVGADAGKQIQNLVLVYNAMAEIKNNLSLISRGLSKVSRNYRKVQLALKLETEELGVMQYDKQAKKEDYYDNRDSISINDSVNTGIEYIKKANSALDVFINEVRYTYSRISDNWTEGAGREKMVKLFERFINDLEQYETQLDDISQAVTRALNNYAFSR